MKTPKGNKYEKTKEDAILKQLNKNTYNGLVFAQNDTVCFRIVEESVTKELPNGCALRALGKLNKKLQ